MKALKRSFTHKSVCNTFFNGLYRLYSEQGQTGANCSHCLHIMFFTRPNLPVFAK